MNVHFTFEELELIGRAMTTWRWLGYQVKDHDPVEASVKEKVSVAYARLAADKLLRN